MTDTATIEKATLHVLPPLPYAENALDPVVTANTIGFHYGKHHKGYVDNLNKLITGTQPPASASTTWMMPIDCSAAARS